MATSQYYGNDGITKEQRKEVCRRQRRKKAAARPLKPKALTPAEHARKYHERHKSKCLERQARWRENNKDKIAKYRHKNKEKFKEYWIRDAARYRALRTGKAEPNNLIYQQILRHDICCYCSKAEVEHYDHIEPLSKKGEDRWDNLTAACGKCNLQKQAKLMLLFMLERR